METKDWYDVGMLSKTQLWPTQSWIEEVGVVEVEVRDGQ